MSISTFPILTKKDSKGKVYTWKIWVENKETYSLIWTEYGYKKLVINKQIIKEGKNIDKKNSTTHYTQAISEAQSKWNKKNDLFNTVFILPMLANEYNDKKDLKFPLYIQPKLDGYRMLYDTQKKVMYSRTGKEVDLDLFPHIKEELLKNNISCVLDGEFYCHDLSFEDLGVIRKKKLTEQDKQQILKIKYYIYDAYFPKNLDFTFQQRFSILKNSIFLKKMTSVCLLDTFTIYKKIDIDNYHNKFIEENYEGSIIRSTDAIYKQNLRSNGLLKYKNFKDAEFLIINWDTEVCPQTNLRLIIWTIKVNGHHCNVRPKGTVQERHDLYNKCKNNFTKLYKGKKLWVKFFEYTEDKNLRFPTTKTNSVTTYIRNEVE